MTLGDVIHRYRTEHGYSMDAFSAASGLSKAYISMLEKNMNPKTKQPITPSIVTFKCAADAMGLSLDALLAMVDENQPIGFSINPEPKHGVRFGKPIPQIGSIACGSPILAEENIEEMVAPPEGLHADFCLRCKGDSMIGCRIMDGDIVYIRQQDDVNDGQIAAVLIDDEATLKRVYKIGHDRLELRPENPAYPVFTYSGEQLNHIRILGLAVAFTSPIK